MIKKQKMRNLNELKKAIENKIPLVWYDTNSIEGKHYKVNRIKFIDTLPDEIDEETPIHVYYGEGSETEVYLWEIQKDPNYMFENITETQWLKIIDSYLNHVVDPQPSIPLDYLESLEVTDLDAVSPHMFEIPVYDNDYVNDLSDALHAIILKREAEDLKKL
jgi:hypothetical protein